MANTTRPLRPLRRRATQQRLLAALEHLACDDMLTWQFVHVDRFPLPKVAHIEGASVGAVRARLERAEQQLREALGDDYDVRRVVLAVQSEVRNNPAYG